MIPVLLSCHQAAVSWPPIIARALAKPLASLCSSAGASLTSTAGGVLEDLGGAVEQENHNF